MKTYNQETCEIIAIKIRNIINNELADNLEPPLNLEDMDISYKMIIKFLEEMKLK